MLFRSEIFMNGPFEFRILKKSKKDIIGVLSTQWEKRLKLYVREEETSKKSFSLSNFARIILVGAIIALLVNFLLNSAIEYDRFNFL